MPLINKFSVLERYRLPVTFHGEFVIHTTSGGDFAAGEHAIQVEERWTQKRLIGKGGFGEVWLEEREGGGQVRAVKRLSRNVRGVDFFRELNTMAMLLDHQRLFVELYGWYEDLERDYVFVAMEYVGGGDLSKYLKTPTIRFEAREITRQLLEGLVVMHERHIAHRDIKPQNILVVSIVPVWVKLADFGVSKLEQDTYLRTTTGTPAYSAPELYGLLPRRLKPQDVYTNSVDMWSLGCVVHEMLTTERPFLEAERATDLESSMWLDDEPQELQADLDLIVDYCRGEKIFPGQSLEKSGASADETSFVKGLLLPDPCLRMSAAEALKSSWLSGVPQADNLEVTPITLAHQRLTQFIKRRGLLSFYPGDLDLRYAHDTERLAEVLMNRGCTRGIASSLGMLIFYDLAILISDGDSMEYDDGGARIAQLKRILKLIASVYCLVRDRGILSIQFIGAPMGKTNVTTDTVESVLTGHDYGGVARIGTGLKKKILDKFISGPGVVIERPLLVIVVTDSPVEGESSGLLESVIKSMVHELPVERTKSKEPNLLTFKAVAFQFLGIGSDGHRLVKLQALSDDKEMKQHVNFRQASDFNHPVDSEEQWTEISQILLTAIDPYVSHLLHV